MKPVDVVLIGLGALGFLLATTARSRGATVAGIFVFLFALACIAAKCAA